MLNKHFFKLATENIGTSFLFGTATSLFSRSFKQNKLRIPDSYDIESSFRAGGELAKHAVIYSFNILLLEKIGIPSYFLHLSSTFLTAFLLAIRNGTNYASKTATLSSLTAFFKLLITKRY